MLTNNEEKLYARMLETRLREIVEELGMLDSAQHGFRGARVSRERGTQASARV
jgi:hypothetical protein